MSYRFTSDHPPNRNNAHDRIEKNILKGYAKIEVNISGADEWKIIPPFSLFGSVGFYVINNIFDFGFIIVYGVF